MGLVISFYNLSNQLRIFLQTESTTESYLFPTVRVEVRVGINQRIKVGGNKG